jgi:hypothetical protein
LLDHLGRECFELVYQFPEALGVLEERPIALVLGWASSHIISVNSALTVVLGS